MNGFLFLFSCIERVKCERKMDRAIHWTLLKAVFNPVLRKCGYSIVSIFDGTKFIRYELRPYPEFCKLLRSKHYGV